MTIDRTLATVTDRIRAPQRGRPHAPTSTRLEKARRRGPLRNALGCTNLAHAFAARAGRRQDHAARDAPAQHRDRLVVQRHAVGAPAVRALSRDHQARRRARSAPSAQFAGGVPAMCDGVTQGEPGMELSLFSRDVIAHGHRGRALAQHVRRRAVPRHLRQDRAGPPDRRAAVRPPADDLRARRADAVGHLQRREGAGAPALRARARSAATRCSTRRRSRTTAPAPAPSTAPPTATRC